MRKLAQIWPRSPIKILSNLVESIPIKIWSKVKLDQNSVGPDQKSVEFVSC